LLQQRVGSAEVAERVPLSRLQEGQFDGLLEEWYSLWHVGVAIAEILADRLPRHLHGMFLPFVEIYNTNPQRSILNLKVLLSTLKSYFSSNA
jgi:hypothetical protein